MRSDEAIGSINNCAYCHNTGWLNIVYHTAGYNSLSSSRLFCESKQSNMTVNIVTWCCYTVLDHARPYNDVSICLVTTLFIPIIAWLCCYDDLWYQWDSKLTTFNVVCCCCNVNGWNWLVSSCNLVSLTYSTAHVLVDCVRVRVKMHA